MPPLCLGETMSSEKQIFANGRVSVISTGLFAMDKFVRLAECKTLQEALKMLSENGYGAGATLDNPNDYDNVLRDELDNALAELKESCYDKNALGFLLATYDFANAKTLMKAKYMRVDGTDGCFAGASYLPEQMQNDFVNDEYHAYPVTMAEACDRIDDRFARGERSPSVVDEELDKAMYAQMSICARRCSVGALKSLCAYRIDSTNIITIARAKKAGFSTECLQKLLLDGGKVKQRTLLSLWHGDNDAVGDLSDELRAVYNACTDIAIAEETKRAHEFEVLSREADSLSVQPVLVYFARKTHEIDLVRMILIGVKNNLPKDKIKANIVL